MFLFHINVFLKNVVLEKIFGYNIIRILIKVKGYSLYLTLYSILMMGGIATIMIYVENADKTYNVYRYSGELIIDRRIVKNIRHDILVNIDNIINE